MKPFQMITNTSSRTDTCLGAGLSLGAGLIAGLTLAAVLSSAAVAQTQVNQAIEALRDVGAEGSGFDRAIPAADRLRQLPPSELPRLLDGIADVNPVAENWFRGLVFDVARQSPGPSVDLLRKYAMDQSNNATGRGLAMELIRREEPATAERLIGQCLNDPSLPLREMAVEQAIGEAEKLVSNDQSSAAIERFRETLTAARHPRQLSRIVEALRDLDQQVTTADAFALLTQWQAVAPFDNRSGIGFATAYPPEQQLSSEGEVDLDAVYPGKNEEVTWQAVEASGDEGVVNLADVYNKEKGAVAYLYTEFESSNKRPAQVRLGCINANKVWVNGKEVMANEVYHSGSMLDQYIAACQLKQGTNRILLKICQNEQTEPWAQEWEFQVRLTDPTGKGLRSGE